MSMYSTGMMGGGGGGLPMTKLSICAAHFVVLIAFAVMYAGIGMKKHFTMPESHKDGGIQSALWFSVTTHTTTGYGDILPLTHSARMLVMSQMICAFMLILALAVV